MLRNVKSQGGVGAHRSTKQRSAINDLVQRTGTFISAQELHHRLHEEGHTIGLTTVYRTLQAMADSGDIDVLINTDGETLYRRCGQRQGHHHHLICRKCGLAVEVQGPEMEKWAEDLAKKSGFTQVGHTLDLFGYCPTCSEVI